MTRFARTSRLTTLAGVVGLMVVLLGVPAHADTARTDATTGTTASQVRQECPAGNAVMRDYTKRYVQDPTGGWWGYGSYTPDGTWGAAGCLQAIDHVEGWFCKNDTPGGWWNGVWEQCRYISGGAVYKYFYKTSMDLWFDGDDIDHWVA